VRGVPRREGKTGKGRGQRLAPKVGGVLSNKGDEAARGMGWLLRGAGPDDATRASTQLSFGLPRKSNDAVGRGAGRAGGPQKALGLHRERRVRSPGRE
jgi:hypothetical protein